MAVKLDELILAHEFVSGGEATGMADMAWVERATGRILMRGDDEDYSDEIPDDIDDPEKYAEVPGKYDLDLGVHLVMDFARRHLSDEDVDQVRSYFRRPGAYARFTNFLDRRGLREQWYRFEREAKARALREWCEEEGIQIED